MTKKMERELAELYNAEQDLSDFEAEPVPVAVRRSVTISVRFSEHEIALLRSKADEADVKVTTFIRAAALEASSPVDRAALGALARELERQAHRVAQVAAGGVATD